MGSPDYLQRYGTPQTPYQLDQHRCINMRLPTRGGIYAWEFTDDGKGFQVYVEGQLTLNSLPQRIDAAESGLGLAYVPDDCVEEALVAGRLVRVLMPGHPPSLVIICIIPAVVSIPLRLRYSSTRCVIELIDI